MKKILTLLMSSTALTACTHLQQPAAEAPNNAKISAEARNQSLDAFNHWHITGAIGVQKNDKAVSANMSWQQINQNTYHVSLQGPIGVGGMKIDGSAGKVVMTTGANKQFSARSAEELINKETGWYLPVSNLYYWARGLAIPGIPSTPQYDQYHHLKSLEQAGWHVDYERYTGVGKLDLPSKMTLTKAPYTVRLVFSSWN